MQVPGSYNSRDTGGEMLSTSCVHFYGPFFDPTWLEPNFALKLCAFITNEDTRNNKRQASKRGSRAVPRVQAEPLSYVPEAGASLAGRKRQGCHTRAAHCGGNQGMLPPKILQRDFLEAVFGTRSNPAFQQRPRRSSGEDGTTVRRGVVPHKLRERICNHRPGRTPRFASS